MPGVRVVSMRYYRGRSGEWHQPGQAFDCAEDEAEELESSGSVRVIRTAMVESPETREIRQARGRRGATRHKGGN